MDSFSRLIVALALLFAGSASHGYGLVNQGSNVERWCYTTHPTNTCSGSSGATGYRPTPEAAADAFIATVTPNAACPVGPRIQKTRTATGASYGWNCTRVSDGVVFTDVRTFQTGRSFGVGCPPNSSVSGGNCICNLGFKGGAFNGVGASESCTPYTCPVTSTPSFSQTTPIAADFACESSGPNAGCVSRDVFDAFVVGDNGTKFYFGHGVTTGKACQEGGISAATDDSPPPEPADEPHEPTTAEKCALGRGVPMCVATVNGTEVCVTCQSSSTNKTETTVTPAGAASAPGGVTPGSRSTETTCTGNACTQTTTTRDAAGTVTSVTTTTGTPASIGTGAYDGNGTGSAGGEEEASGFGASCAAGAAAITCEGDAVQCSIAREQYRRQCEFFEQTNDETAVAIAAKAAGVEGAEDHPARSPTTLAVGSFDQTDIVSGSCPADRSVTIGAATVALPFSKVCAPASQLGSLLVAVTALACVAIAFRGT